MLARCPSVLSMLTNNAERTRVKTHSHIQNSHDSAQITQRLHSAHNNAATIVFPSHQPYLQKAVTASLRFITQSVYIAVFLIFSKFYCVFALTYEVAIKNKVRGRVKKQHYFSFSLHFLCCVPLTPGLLAGRPVLILAHNQFILITMGTAVSGGGEAAC